MEELRDALIRLRDAYAQRDWWGVAKAVRDVADIALRLRPAREAVGTAGLDPAASEVRDCCQDIRGLGQQARGAGAPADFDPVEAAAVAEAACVLAERCCR